MTLYKDYFGIRPDYTPIMTLANIDKSPETWLAFYPHESFVEILRELLKSLNGGKKTLWITGAYGTGKSHASLVLQKMFSDDKERLLKWFDLRNKQIPEPVRKGVLEQRDHKVLVVYDVNADGVDAKNHFLMRLQRGITKALEKNEYTIPLKGKLDEVIERIRQDEPHFFAQRDEMQDQLSYLNAGIQTTDALEKKLREANQEAGLVNDAMRVLEARSIYLGSSAEEFLEWIDASLKMNGLTKLVYIWDEFSAFMDRNRAELKTLEQLAEAAQQGQFYFVPVTHMEIPSYVAVGSESAKKLNDRFTFKRIEMPNETALKLAADAFVVNPGQKVNWEEERDFLWHNVNSLAENYMAVNKSGIETNDFKGILPVHPMAAFLLKHLSVAIGSNQRSMFEFLNGEEFKEFIEKGGLDVPGHQILTVDHLWRYFVERDDLGTEQAIHEARGEYSRREQELQPDEQRVFKAVLLFGLIEQMQGTGHPLLSVSVENIRRSFEGDGDLQGVDFILRNLERKHCFGIVNGRCERFRDSGDNKEIEEKKATLEGKFSKLVLEDTQTELDKFLKSINFGGRFDVRVAGVNNLSPSSIKPKSFGENGNRVLVQFILAKDEEERLRIPDKTKNLARQFKDHRMIFVNLPEVSFCHDDKNLWKKFVENSARLAVASDNQSRQIFETQITDAKNEWHKKIKRANKLLVARPNSVGEPFTEEVTWGQLKKDWLNNFAKQVFGAYTDDLSGFNLSAFAAPNALQSWALAGMEFDKFTKNGPWKTVVKAWQKKGISGEVSWFEENPQHPLSQLRTLCKKRQDTTVGAGNNCSIRKLYIELQRAPYGLLCVPHSAFVLGFVLKTWLTGQRKLQWTDGITSKALDAITLAEIIESVVKDDGANNIRNEKLICRLSKEEKVFIEQSSVIFGGSPLSDGTVEAALAAVGSRLEQISQRVPLWVLPDHIQAQAEPSAEAMGKIIDALCLANSISSKGDTEARSNKVREIGEILSSTPGLAEAMAQYMIPVVFEDAFQRYIDTAKPELKAVMERIGGAAHMYCSEVKDRLAETSSWLWKQGDTEVVLEEVYRQTLCVEHIRKIAGLSGYMAFEDALCRLRNAIQTENKVPTEFWTQKHPALQRLFELLARQLLSSEDIKTFEQILEQQGEVIGDLFFDTAQVKQLAAMNEIFGDIWPKAEGEGHELYNAFAQNSAASDVHNFKIQGRNKIEEYSRTLVSKQVAALWLEFTGTDSPKAWSHKHKLPAECILLLDDAKSVVDAVADSGGVSAKRLQVVHGKLQKENVFVDVSAAGDRFLKRVMPKGYQKFEHNIEELCNWLFDKLGDDPDQWLANGRLQEEIEEFVRQRYETQARPQAVKKVNALSDTEVRALLLELINHVPEVGLLVLE